jgi:hypothetical protein
MLDILLRHLSEYWMVQVKQAELTPYAKPNNSSSYSHHPEHTSKCISLLVIREWTVDVTRWLSPHEQPWPIFLQSQSSG